VPPVVDFDVGLTRVFSARLTRHNDGNLLSGFECAPFWVGECCLEKPTGIGSVGHENQAPGDVPCIQTFIAANYGPLKTNEYAH
jgi:hypothetical protein